MSGFEKHGLKHTSPSALNMWADCAGAWAARYLYNKKLSFGVAPQIGMLVEQVCAQVLTKTMDFDYALKLAHDKFNKDNALNTSAKDRERISDIEAMATLAIKELEPYGVPHFDNCVVNGRKQQKVELLCKGDGWELPVIGFLDFVYPDQGLVIDLKTTLRMPSTMSEAHKRQAAIYKRAMGNHHTRFLYVTPKKSQFHDLEDEKPILENVKQILNRQEKMLALHDKETLRQILPVNTSSFYWNGCENVSKELYGL